MTDVVGAAAGIDVRGGAGPEPGTPLVTVITIFLDPPLPFFEEAIASVAAQTEARWELLLVDDGSAAEAAEFARRAAAADPARIRVLSHPGGGNAGMSASRNLGIAAARGRFVAFLDADDVYLSGKLRHQVDILDAHPDVAMVYGPTPHWHGWTGRPEDAARDAVRRLGVAADAVARPPLLARAFLGGRADTPATCGVLLRREAIAAVGGFEPRFHDLYEDQAFFYKVCLGWPVFVESTAWDRYRRHPDAWCEVRIAAGEHADDDRPTAARGAFLAWLETWLDAIGCDDAELRRALRRQRWPFRHPVRHGLALRIRDAARRLLPARVRRLGRRLADAIP